MINTDNSVSTYSTLHLEAALEELYADRFSLNLKHSTESMANQFNELPVHVGWNLFVSTKCVFCELSVISSRYAL